MLGLAAVTVRDGDPREAAALLREAREGLAETGATADMFEPGLSEEIEHDLRVTLGDFEVDAILDAAHSERDVSARAAPASDGVGSGA